MQLAAPPSLSLGWLAFPPEPGRFAATIVVKSTCRLKNGAPAEPMDDPDPVTGDSPAYATDLAPIKPRTDVLLHGTCHVPGGKAVDSCLVGLGVGRLSKRLAVFGDRRWILGRISPPQPFTRMPLLWDRAFSGPRRETLPNLEIPDRLIRTPDDRPEPAGFGPIPPSWPSRREKLGTFDAAWRKERWPWYPADFDWSYFNAAPRDQQLDSPLRGDEEIVLENLHPVHAVYRTRLPGIRARVFARLEGRDQEVPLLLDTLQIDPDAEKLTLVWRGRIPVRDRSLAEVERIYAVAERLDQGPAPMSHHLSELERAREAEEAEFEIPDSEPEPEPPDTAEAEMDREFAKAEAEATRAEKQAIESAIVMGADPKTLAVPPAGGDLRSMNAEFRRHLSEVRKEHPELADRLKEAEPQDPAEIEAMEREPDPEPAEPEWTRESVAASRGRDLSDQDLTGLDLSGLDLTGTNFAGAILSAANLHSAILAKCNLREADLSKANLTGADLREASLDEADLDGARLTDANLRGASLHDSLFSKADLGGADLRASKGKGAEFSGARLAKARLAEAALPSSDFSGADLSGADLSKAILKGAFFEGTRAPGATFAGADLQSLQAGDRADLSGALLREVDARGSTWIGAVLDGADFSGAVLRRADLSGATLRKALFHRTDLREADFSGAAFAGTRLLESDACAASFERSDLKGAQLHRSNFYAADFREAQIQDGTFSDSNLDGTLLAE